MPETAKLYRLLPICTYGYWHGTFFQTSFSVKLESFDNAKKVTLIKEIKNLVEGMNLVQAKKFVESCPTVVKADLSKDEAEKLKEALTAAGATCKIE